MYRSSQWIVLCICLSILLHASLVHGVSFTSKGAKQRLTPTATAKLATSLHDASALVKTIRTIAIERPIGSEGHATVQAAIIDAFESLEGWHVSTDRFTDTTPKGEFEFVNVIATFDALIDNNNNNNNNNDNDNNNDKKNNNNNDNDKKKNSNTNDESHNNNSTNNEPKRLILAAHYESKRLNDSQVFIGATDSAIPVAILIELAKSIQPHLLAARNEHRLRSSLQLIFFDGEEAFVDWSESDSLYGSRHLASHWESTNQLQSIELFVLLDLIGAPTPSVYNYFGFSCTTSGTAFSRMTQFENLLSHSRSIHIDRSELGEPLEHQSFKTPLQAPRYFLSNQIGRDFLIEDDHKPFKQRGVPVLHVIPLPYPEVWHKSDDDLHHVDWSVVHDFATITRAFVLSHLSLS